MSDRPFRILSIDGGGVGGAFSAQVLSSIEAYLNINILDHFDMVAGTSTGSIVASALVQGQSGEELVELFNRCANKVFNNKKLSSKILFSSKFSRRNLNQILTDVLGDVRLGDIDFPLVIPTTDIGNGMVNIYKSNYNSELNGQSAGVLLKDAVLASTAAPTYFDPYKVNLNLMADGGLWANNPSLVAFFEARDLLQIDPARIRVFSLGTIDVTKSNGIRYGVQNQGKNWGLLQGWGGSKLVSMLMNLQVINAHNTLGKVIGFDKMMRICPRDAILADLDDVKSIPDLLSNADQIVSRSQKGIQNFLNL